jgi:hypothetical protein
MANTCTITTSAYQGRYMQLVCNQTKNVASNTSTISWTLTVAGGESNYYTTKETIVRINGQQVYYDAGKAWNTYKFPAGKGSVSGTINVPHDGNGSKTIEVYLKTSIYDSTIRGETKSWTLDSIPRMSPISVGAEFTMGSSGKINIASSDSSYRHTVTYLWGDTTPSGISAGKGYKGTIATKTASTSLDWTPPVDLANVIPNDKKGMGSLLCETYSGDTLIGSTSTTFIAHVPASVIPSITSFVAERVNNGVPDSWGLYIQGKSQCKLTATGAGAYKSTITSCTIKYAKNGAVISSTSQGTSGVLTESGNVTFTATVTDSRGRTASKDVTIAVTPYSLPTINSVLSQRSTSNGTLDDNGTYIRTVCEYTVASCNGKNTPTCNVYYRKSGDSSWSASKSFTSGSAVILAGDADTDSSYEVKFEVADALSTMTFIDVVSTSFTTIDLKKGGRGFAIGKVSEKECFECAMDAEFTGTFSADLSQLIVMQSFTSERLTVDANKVVDALIDITKEGYTALGTVGVHTSHGSALIVVSHLEAPTQAKVTVRNVGTTQIIVAPSVDILYVKNI